MNKYKNFQISNTVIDLALQAEQMSLKQFENVHEIENINQLKVLNAFHINKIGEVHFSSTNGYGYNDVGRDAIDRLFATIFDTEDALVRHNIISGTHAISVALNGILRPNDLLLSVTGKPYDTLEEVIGLRGEGKGSLKDFGIKYKQIDYSLNKSNSDDFLSIIKEEIPRLVFFQKSRGYAAGKRSISAAEIGRMIELIKRISPNIICFVDNCYGEFVEDIEPTNVGADLIAGSLIKNAGGGIVQSGGYIAGRKQLVELAAYKLNSVGIGKEAGASLGHNREILQGIFMAPHIVAQAKKSAIFCANLFKLSGFTASPDGDDYRADIVQSIQLKSEEELSAFCEGIQKGSPIDSFVAPKGWSMPGYSCDVIMAAGGFVQGSSIELSADAPIKPPFTVYIQGGLTYYSAKLGVMMALDNVLSCKNR
ncbi:MAG: methionine gamma-lyase family protein [Clostridiales bacterium]|jgi:cystathionine beta-lyase family protein involved in aluminum resistance|nr:methionine gamma-lyase family protein [Clostridiales bacterium]